MSNRITRANAVIIAALSLATALIGGCATSMPVGRAATGDKPPLELPHKVAFIGVQDVFSRNAIGDAIVITAVHGTAPTIAIGNTYRIDGAYTLASRDEADLAADLTGSAGRTAS